LPDKPCFATPSYNIYGIQEYGQLAGEQNMLQEIFQRGPISCSVHATQELDDYTGGIFEDKTGPYPTTNHAISVVGWGVEHGVKYWLVRNSWGSHWGEQGFFRIRRGIDNLLIESHCAWATPIPEIIKEVHNITESEMNDPINKGEEPEVVPKKDELFNARDGCRKPRNNWAEKGFVPPKEYSWDVIP